MGSPILQGASSVRSWLALHVCVLLDLTPNVARRGEPRPWNDPSVRKPTHPSVRPFNTFGSLTLRSSRHQQRAGRIHCPGAQHAP